MIDNAIILSAGQGSRLLPLTRDLPKCMIDLSGKTLIEWQVDALRAAGICNITVVTGFHTEKLEALLARMEAPAPRPLFNPFYKVADNLGSCWMAREAMGRDFLILNGDTLVSPSTIRRLITRATAPITVTIDVKPDYDLDDMKVHREGDRLLAIGKGLSADVANAESIGMLAFQGSGPALFRAKIEAMMRSPEGTRNWYLKAIDALASEGVEVGTVSVEGDAWAEVDFPEDVETARALTRRWATRAA